MVLKKRNEIKKVCIIERSVTETKKSFPVLLFMVNDEFMRTVIHQFHQFPAFINNSCSVAPGKYGSEQTGYFYVLLFSEQVRDGYRIQWYE